MYGSSVITNEFGHDMSGTKNLPFKFSFYGRWVYFEYIFSNIPKHLKSLVFIE